MRTVVDDPDVEPPWERVKGPRPCIAAAARTGDDQTDSGAFSKHVGEGGKFDPQVSWLAGHELLNGFGSVQVART